MAEGLISDPETDKIVAILRGGVVYRFHNDTEKGKIATIVGTCLYDLNGNLLVQFCWPPAWSARDWTRARSPCQSVFRELLEDKS